MSWVFPGQDCPLWQRIGYLVFGIFLAISTSFLGINSDLFVFIYLGKSCFLLERKQVYLMTAITGFFWVLGQLLSNLILVKQPLQANLPSGFETDNLITFTIVFGSIYLISSTLAILFSLMMIAEYKSRKRAESLAEQVETLATALERHRIARDIHDSLGHTLTDLDNQLEVAQKLRHHNPNQALQAIDTAKLLASQCIEEVSQAIQTMRQSDFDLNQALATLVEQVRQNPALQVHYEINFPPLPLQTSHQIYCIVKEGITNIQKHAHASQIWFRGHWTTEEILLELKDNGVGFDLERVQRKGFGIQGIAERVQLLGGALTINTDPDQGTQILVVLPL
ncbi:MAG: sensor histidine kinase [Aphanocapsa sp. GSE-SYN-MK-11-07L]|nr:sensor histidine kinase [Aphanocapsa sp. GSE-SYN-MK-11-07L]